MIFVLAFRLLAKHSQSRRRDHYALRRKINAKDLDAQRIVRLGAVNVNWADRTVHDGNVDVGAQHAGIFDLTTVAVVGFNGENFAVVDKIRNFVVLVKRENNFVLS